MLPTPARPNVVEVDLDALDHNHAILRRLVGPETRVIASVKGNAYGLGLREVATRLARLGVPALATGSFGDALAIRQAGLDIEVVMFGGALPDAMPEYVSLGLIPTVHNLEVGRAVSDAASGRYPVYVKVDCGWGRLGHPVATAKDFVLAVADLPRVEVRGLYTHMPFGDEAGRAWAQRGLAAFDGLVGALAAEGLSIPVTQSRSSAGVLAGLEDRCSAVSPGGLLYGRSPLAPGMSPHEAALRPVLAGIRTRLIHVSPSAADRSSPWPSRYADQVTGATGVVPFGRADGNRAPLPGRSNAFLIRGRRAPVLGVSTEHCVIDLSAVPDPQVGEEVVVLGTSGPETVTLADLAAAQQTTGSDILLMMSERLTRVFRGA